MSSCRGSLCLLVVLGVVFASGSPVQFVSENLVHTHESIENALGLTKPDIITNPLFSSVISSINCSCQDRVELMNITLDVYTRIFSSILHHSDKTPALLDQVRDSDRSLVEDALKQLQRKMKELKKHLRHQACNREDVINKLNKIQVDDPVVQRKALAQFKEIYQAASVVRHRCEPM